MNWSTKFNLPIIFFLCFIFSTLSTSFTLAKENSESLSSYLALFEQPNIFRAKYKKVKHLPSLSRGLRSEGNNIYIKERGLIWLMKTPFKMTTVIKGSKLNLWVEGEKQPQQKKYQNMIKPVLQNISAIFTGDFKYLKKDFILHKKFLENRKWEIILIPTSSYIKPYLQKIIINGMKYIESVNIVYTNDKYTIVTYEKPLIGSSYITKEEREIFDK